MKEQVLSVEQMQELIDMGIDASKASMCWTPWRYIYESDDKGMPLLKTAKTEYYLKVNNEIDYWEENIPAFTLQDILEYLKGAFKEVGDVCLFHEGDIWICSCIRFSTCEQSYYNNYEQTAESSLLATFNMLKFCKQNNYI